MIQHVLLTAVLVFGPCACRTDHNNYHWRRICPWFSRSKTYGEMSEYQTYTTSWPFCNSLDILPESPSEQKIKYMLYNSTDLNTTKFLDAENQNNITLSGLEPGKVAFVIHGFTDAPNSTWVTSLVKELAQKVSNVIAVDWSWGARGPKLMYPQATANTRVVGAQTAILIKKLVKAGIKYSDIHIIGHSLGAQVAGYAGEKFTNPKIGRISGLDPAGPNFQRYDKRVRLDPGDAEFVDVIHTSTLPIPCGYGIAIDCGHVDFWPNGGEIMPGCGKCDGSCNHAKVTEYYVASVNRNTFPARSCALWYWFPFFCGEEKNYMGYGAMPNPSGRFYLKTNASYPFP